jgi:hypothetical protein
MRRRAIHALCLLLLALCGCAAASRMGLVFLDGLGEKSYDQEMRERQDLKGKY